MSFVDQVAALAPPDDPGPPVQMKPAVTKDSPGSEAKAPAKGDAAKLAADKKAAADKAAADKAAALEALKEEALTAGASAASERQKGLDKDLNTLRKDAAPVEGEADPYSDTKRAAQGDKALKKAVKTGRMTQPEADAKEEEEEETPAKPAEPGKAQDEIDKESKIRVSGMGLSQTHRPDNKHATTADVGVVNEGGLKGLKIGGTEEKIESAEPDIAYETTAEKKRKRREKAEERAKSVKAEKERLEEERKKKEAEATVASKRREKLKDIRSGDKRRRKKKKQEQRAEARAGGHQPEHAKPEAATEQVPDAAKEQVPEAATEEAPIGSRKASKTTTRSADGTIGFDPDKKRIVIKGEAGESVVDDAGAEEQRADTTEEQRAKDDKAKAERTKVKERKIRGGAAVGADGGDASVGHTATDGTEADKTTKSVDLTVGTDGAAADASRARERKTDDGGSVKNEVAGAIKVGKQNQASLAAKRTMTGADGQQQQVGGSAAADFDKGEYKAQVNAAALGADGKPKATVAAGGAIRTHKDKGKGHGAEGDLAFGGKGKTVKLGGSYDFYVTTPKRVVKGGKVAWVVTVNEVTGGSVGGGASGAGGGGHLSASTKKAKKLTKRFWGKGGRGKALAFYEGGYKLAMATRLDAKAAKAMEEGDVKEQTSESQAGAGATVKAGVVEIGFSIKRARTAGIKILREAGDFVVVEVSRGIATGAGASLGTAGGGMSWGSSQDKSSSYQVRFHLKKNRKAFETFVASKGKTLPPGGWKIVGTASMERETDNFEAKLLGAKASKRSYHEQSKKTDEFGNEVEKDAAGVDVAVDVPLLGGVNRTDELSATQINDKETLYVGTSTVSDTNAADSKKALARRLDKKREDLDTEGKSSGKWSITTVFGEKHIDSFIGRVKAGKVNGAGILTDKDPLDDLKGRLRAARGDKDKERAALAKFVKASGGSGMALIRSQAGGRQYVELAGDKNFSGLKGRIALQKKLARWRKQLNGSDMKMFGDVAREVQNELTKHKKRLAAVSNKKKYPDLPEATRRDEMDQSSADITTLKVLLKQAKTGAKEHRKANKKKRREKKIDQKREEQQATHGEIANERNYTHATDDYQEVQSKVPDVDVAEQVNKEDDAKEKKYQQALTRATDAKGKMEAAKGKAREAYVAAHSLKNKHRLLMKEHAGVFDTPLLWVMGSDRRIAEALTREGHADKVLAMARENTETLGIAANMFAACRDRWQRLAKSYRSAIKQYRYYDKLFMLKEGGRLAEPGRIEPPF